MGVPVPEVPKTPASVELLTPGSQFPFFPHLVPDLVVPNPIPAPYVPEVPLFQHPVPTPFIPERPLFSHPIPAPFIPERPLFSHPIPYVEKPYLIPEFPFNSAPAPPPIEIPPINIPPVLPPGVLPPGVLPPGLLPPPPATPLNVFPRPIIPRPLPISLLSPPEHHSYTTHVIAPQRVEQVYFQPPVVPEYPLLAPPAPLPSVSIPAPVISELAPYPPAIKEPEQVQEPIPAPHVPAETYGVPSFKK